MPDHLQQVASATTKAKRLSAQRIAPQYLLHLQRQACKALPHVSVASRQPYPHAARNRNHGSVSSPRMIRSSVSTSTSQSTITRRPFAITISIRRQSVPWPFPGCSGTIIAGTNPGMSPSRPSRYALRQANRSWLEIPCRRAVADASRGAEILSSTIRSFSAADHRRRRPVSTISRRLMWRESIRSSIPTISYIPDNSARRPTPGGYPLAQSDGHDSPGLIDELVPRHTAVVDEIVVRFEDAVRQPVVTQELPDVFDRIELGTFRRQRHNGDVWWHDESRRQVPAGLIDQEYGVCAGRDGGGDLHQVQVHRLGVAGRQDPGCPPTPFLADATPALHGSGALVAGRTWARAALRPAAGARVLFSA